MPQSGEWFSPRTRPEMLTNEDPPVSGETTHDRLEILPGPATLRARIVAPARRAAAFVPALGRRLVRVDDEPSRWQLAGMWAAGSAIVAGTGLAVAAVLGGAPPALTHQFDRLSVLPGLNEHGEDAPAPAADNAKHETSRRSTSTSSTSSSAARDRASAEGSSSPSSYVGYSGVPGVPAGADLPAEVAQAAGVPPQSGATAPQPGSPRPPAGGGGTTAPGGPTVPPVGDPAPPVVDPTPPVVDPTDPPPPVVDPTDPAPPVDTPTDPVPPDTPTDPPPVETPTDPPADNPPADNPPVADNPIDTPPADPTPAPIDTPTP